MTRHIAGPCTEAVPDGWSLSPLGDLTTWMSGGTPSKGNPDFWDGHIPWISAKSLKSFFLYDSDDHVTEAAIAEGARQAEVGDILMLVRGMTLHNNVPVGIAMCPMTFNQDVKAIRGKGNASTRYIAYWLVGNKWRLLAAVDQASHGTGRLRTEVVQSMEVLLPPPEEQRAIAAVLGSLDDKIEQNRKTAAALERLARAIFKAWFVDFEPVKAKAAGAKSFPSMPQDAFDSLPTTFTDSELGPIPEGWEVVDVYKLAKVVYGAPFKSKFFNAAGDGLPLIRIRDLHRHDPEVFTPEEHPKGYAVEPGNIAVGMDGEFRLHYWTGPRAWLNQRVCVFEPRKHAPRMFLGESLRKPLQYFERSKTGTTVIHLGKGDIDTFRLIMPSMELLRAFGNLTETLLDLSLHLASESRKLTTTREMLLAPLLSGAVRVEIDDKTEGARR